MRLTWRGPCSAFVWIGGLLVAVAAQAQEKDAGAARALGIAHPNARARGQRRRREERVCRHGKSRSVGPRAHGAHHLRHVEPALVPGCDPAGRRAGAGDEPGGRRGPSQGRFHHPRP